MVTGPVGKGFLPGLVSVLLLLLCDPGPPVQDPGVLPPNPSLLCASPWSAVGVSDDLTQGVSVLVVDRTPVPRMSFTLHETTRCDSTDHGVSRCPVLVGPPRMVVSVYRVTPACGGQVVGLHLLPKVLSFPLCTGGIPPGTLSTPMCFRGTSVVGTSRG